MQFKLPQGKETIQFTVPDSLAVRYLAPRQSETLTSLEKALNHAFDAPEGCPPLDQLISGKRSVLIICDDATRPTPIHLILPFLLGRLLSGGIPEDRIRILMAYGLHRPMEPSELEGKLGRETVERYKILHHDAFNREDHQLMGTTSLGTPLYLNRAPRGGGPCYWDREHLSLSNEAGYGGGAKIIMPGVARAESIYRSHAKVRENPKGIGNMRDNPIRKEIDESAAMTNLVFIINTVLNEKDEICALACGDPQRAFVKGVEDFNRIYRIEIEDRFDLLVVSSSPMDDDFYQANKALSAGSLGVRDGGRLIMLSPCAGGISTFPYFDEMITGGDTYETWQEKLLKPEFRHKVAAEICLSIRYILDVRKIKVGLVTPGISREDIRRMGMAPYRSLEEGLRDAVSREGENLRMGVIPKGPLTLLTHQGF